MVRTRTDHIILWPSYFDSTKTRADGRRVPKAKAVQNPTAAELLEAVKSLGLKATILEEKAYPRNWWEWGGCVSVEKSLAKTALIGRTAPKLKQIRESGAKPEA
jgi:signal recognition particle subunit SRP19